MRASVLSATILVFCSCGGLLRAQSGDPFAEGVRTTEPLSPQEAQRAFELPPGFEIQLVAAEPDIQKPLNMAFDAKGRLWITDTTEYPYALPPGTPGRDSIKILEDADGDGRAEKISTFAGDLNIPIGIYPYHGGVIAFSIPHVWKFTDDNGDGVADRREPLYGPMGWERDTHGLNNAFRRGFDGWLYACHGFNNDTTVAGKDGHSIRMQSGNTYRMRLDGSRIEQFTWGQVNPFGMTFDPRFNIFTADCHSKPVYQLLRGGYYPSFGKPDDGLGFVAPMMEHLHGSTAIAGVAYYTGANFPPGFRGNLYSGNVMTSRVNRNSLVYHGSTILAHEEPDFVATSDPWFRPVDVVVGPDGALYIADFYNRIIGHYEVSLDHPGRDRHRGRIWRVVYRGDDADSVPVGKPSDLSTAPIADLMDAWDDPVLQRRMLAADEVVDRIGAAAIPAVQRAFEQSPSSLVRQHALWALFRLGAVRPHDLDRAATDRSPELRGPAMKVLSEVSEWSPDLRGLALRCLQDDDAFVRRAAADALGQHPQPDQLRPLLAALSRVAAADNHLRHVIRMALRNHLRDPGSFAALTHSPFSGSDTREIAEICLAVPEVAAAEYLIHYVRDNSVDDSQAAAYLGHAARHMPTAQSSQLAQMARRRFANNVDLQTTLLIAIGAGLAQRDEPLAASLTEWGHELASELLDSTVGTSGGWGATPLSGKLRADNPWVIEERASADGDTDSRFLGSLPLGETLTGRLRSPDFEIPSRLSFYLAGHVGPPDQPVVAMNFVRLRDAGSNEVLAETQPPRNDLAQRTDWDLSAHAGKQGYLEVIDGDYRPAYAWIAVGRFDPAMVKLPDLSPSRAAQRQQAAAGIAERLKLSALQPRLVELILAPDTDATAAEALARALTAIQPDSRVAALAPALGDISTPDTLRERIKLAVAERQPESIRAALGEAFRVSPQPLQQRMAETLASDKTGGESLLELVKQGQASPRLLQNRTIQAQLLAASPEVQSRIDELTAGLPSQNTALDRRIVERRIAFAASRPSLENGARVFAKQCAACHQLAGQGATIGPQLDGIGARGVERLIEDLIDPNRNVDVAFRTTTLILESGRVVTGLLRREEGAVLVLADNKGQEFRVSKTEVDQQSQTAISLMPENLIVDLPVAEIHDLLGFLESQRKAPPSSSGKPGASGESGSLNGKETGNP